MPNTKYFETYSVGDILRYLRNSIHFSQREFARMIGKTGGWIAYKELNQKKIYIDDFIMILKTFNFHVILFRKNDERKINLREHDTKDIIRILRELSELSVIDFVNIINKSDLWFFSNEAGRTKYYANDLFELAKKLEFIVEIVYTGRC